MSTPQNHQAPLDGNPHELQAKQIRNCFEKLYAKYGHRFVTQFQYALYPTQTLGIPPQQGIPPGKPPLQVLSHHQAQKLVKAFPPARLETSTKAYRTYRAGKILALKKTSEDQFGRLQWETYPGHQEEELLQDPSQKLLWPDRQKKGLASLLRKALDIGLKHTARNLGENLPPFITLCKVEFYDEDFTRAIITYGKNKHEANQKAKTEATSLWRNDPEVQAKQEPFTKKTLTCLTLRECKKILQLLEKS
jgi:hypothetical protein